MLDINAINPFYWIEVINQLCRVVVGIIKRNIIRFVLLYYFCLKENYEAATIKDGNTKLGKANSISIEQKLSLYLKAQHLTVREVISVFSISS